MTRHARQRAERRGRRGERAASILLILKGWRILGRRVKTPLGEIDLIARKGRTLAFVEVKWRNRREAAREAFHPRQQVRLMRAAALWRARRTGLDRLATRFDLICVAPGRWPEHLKGVASADYGPENHLI
ncbi:YraN family protein [Glycocaulis sp.]|uniref:YraN family protein n=1 Tax=Glycocaulis sp. TaxID=1969725 RepID=UPI003D1EEC58